MTFTQLTYKIFRKVFRVIHFKVDHIITYFQFKILNINFNRFSTAGIPIIDVGSKMGGSIMIGDNFRMSNGLTFNHIGFPTPCVLHAKGGNIVIGKNVGISQTVLIAEKADIIIGNNVLLGGGVKIYTTDFHSLDYVHRRNITKDYDNMQFKSVYIGDDCFIGAGTIVLKGVNIGRCTIIGAGSVVAKDIPPNCIAAGNPCKVIKEFINT